MLLDAFYKTNDQIFMRDYNAILNTLLAMIIGLGGVQFRE